MSCLAAHGQTVEELAKSLEGHTFVLRNYYTDDNLTFDATGKLISQGTYGFGPTDGVLEVRNIALDHKTMTLMGQRSAYLWDEVISKYKLVAIERSVKITMALPSRETADALALLNKVFWSQSDLPQSKCLDTDIDVHDFSIMTLEQRRALWANAPNDAKKICFPGGERAYFKSNGLEAPKAVHMPDPVYSEAATRAQKEGTVIIDMIVDASGVPTTLIVTRTLGFGLDEAALAKVRTWRFTPALFQGKPTPVAVTVEVNFRLRH